MKLILSKYEFDTSYEGKNKQQILESKLLDESDNKSNVIVLTGKGGVGKRTMITKITTEHSIQLVKCRNYQELLKETF